MKLANRSAAPAWPKRTEIVMSGVKLVSVSLTVGAVLFSLGYDVVVRATIMFLMGSALLFSLCQYLEPIIY